MSQYIKSHSNYVLKSKHQSITDGTIWERDITTIGGLNTFTPHQTPTYRSNNFIITVRDDGGVSKQHNTKKWVDNGNNSEVWTINSISSTTTSTDFEDDTQIVLKQDYYDFSDFAYYGSLSELFRASITDAISRFPGELYGTDKNVYYTTGETIDGEWIEGKEILGEDEGLKYLINPFGIDIHSKNKPIDANPLRYFADNGYKNYELNGSSFSYSVTYATPTHGKEGEEKYFCKGDKLATIKINSRTIYAYLGDDNIVYYLSKQCNGVHIRPTEAIQKKFYKECDNFQKLILNKDTSPRYKAIFSVIHENQFGYYREFEEFIFPTSEGGYNIDASSYGFNEYTTRLSQIGEFYDEYFTDNLYRSMTHEAIKNFDWTYTREFNEGDEEEYVLGGEKMQKALRVFAREFDEVLAYINSIKSSNRISYDERSNIPDYFLTDIVEDDGWNVVLPMPYDLTEYYLNGNVNNDYTESYGDCNGQINNKDRNGELIARKFSQNPIATVTPYASSAITDGTNNGYFVQCCRASSGVISLPYYNSSNYYVVSAKTNQFTEYDSCADVIRNRIKSYTDEKKYTYQDVSNEFLRRLKINSRHILRHKGTIEGIEMMLGMFGLKSKRYNENNYDYDVTEYVATSNTIRDKWDSIHQMHEIDWFNSTKTITYDYRSMSNYNRDSIHVDYYPYQGLMISYIQNYYFISGNTKLVIDFSERKIKENSISGNTKYLINNDDSFNESGKLYYIRPMYIEDNNGDKKYELFYYSRTLYPNFNKGEQYDGNPYFQMNGGWLSKKVIGSGGTYNFQFDADNNIVSSDTDVFKETVRNIRRFNTLQDMLSVPSNELYNGQVVYVSNIGENTAVLDGKVYELQTDSYGSYIELVKESGIVKAGDDLFFDEYVTVYNRDMQEQSYFLDDMPNGHIIKAYIDIKEDDDGKKDYIIKCYDDIQGVESFNVLNDDTNYSNYFEILNISNSNRLYDDFNESASVNMIYKSGWKRLGYSDNKYKLINTIINDNKGNNPHNGNMIYDNGEEYHNYYRQLFKYAYENDLFDERCYENFEESASSAYSASVFSAASFTINSGFKEELNDTHYPKVTPYTSAYTIGNQVYHEKRKVTNDILNTKLIQIRFNLHNEEPFSHDGQCELKYLDDIVMNYLTQMIPSTAILQIKYDKKS